MMIRVRQFWRWLIEPTLAEPHTEATDSRLAVGRVRDQICVLGLDSSGRAVFHGHLSAAAATRLSAELYRQAAEAAMVESGVSHAGGV